MKHLHNTPGFKNTFTADISLIGLQQLPEVLGGRSEFDTAFFSLRSESIYI
jgi:hypothetical protein